MGCNDSFHGEFFDDDSPVGIFFGDLVESFSGIYITTVNQGFSGDIMGRRQQ